MFDIISISNSKNFESLNARCIHKYLLIQSTTEWLYVGKEKGEEIEVYLSHKNTQSENEHNEESFSRLEALYAWHRGRFF